MVHFAHSILVKLEKQSHTDNTDKVKGQTSTPITPRKRKGSSSKQESVSKFFKAYSRGPLNFSLSPETSSQNISATSNISQRIPVENQLTATAESCAATTRDPPYDFAANMNENTIASVINQLPPERRRELLAQLNLPINQGAMLSQQDNRSSGNQLNDNREHRQFVFTAVNDQADRLYARNRLRGSHNGNVYRGNGQGRGNSRGRGSNAFHGNNWDNRGGRGGRGSRGGRGHNNGWRDANRNHHFHTRQPVITNTAAAGASANAPVNDHEIPIVTFDDGEIADALTVWWVKVGFPQKFFDKSQIGKVLFILHNFIRMHCKKYPDDQISHDHIAHVAILGGCAMITATNAKTKDWLMSAWSNYIPQTWDDEIFCTTIDHATATAENNETSPLNNVIRIQTLDDENKDMWRETIDLSHVFPFESRLLVQFEGSKGVMTSNKISYVTFDVHAEPSIAQEIFKLIGKGHVEHKCFIGHTERVIRLQMLKFVKPSLSEIHQAAIAAIADHLGKSIDPMRAYNKGKFAEMWKFLKMARFIAGIHSEDVNHDRITDDFLDQEMDANETIVPAATSSTNTRRQNANGRKSANKNSG